jgi:CUG-BP- and ETR3-like factor
MSGSNYALPMPDDDASKMFVGQIPRMWGESELLEFFSDYGKVFDLQVLKDKMTRQSRGCCFVTFYSKEDATRTQEALDGTIRLPGN